MSEEAEGETAFEDVAGEEGDVEVVEEEASVEAPSPSGAPADVAQPLEWVTELLGRLAAGDTLNAADQRRATYAQQLQSQQFAAQQEDDEEE